MAYKEMYDYAKKFNNQFLATAFGDTSVQVVHEEGTYMFFRNAFFIKREEWYMIFTEHHGFFVYHEDDVKVIEYREKYF